MGRFFVSEKFITAEDELLLALNLSESVLGPKHPYVFEILNELAVLYELLENLIKQSHIENS